MSLYFVIFGSLIGPNIKPEVTDGFAYVQYMIPGLIMMSVITNSYANVVSSFYSVKFQKSIEELLISPMPNWAVLLGFISGGIVRGFIVGLVVIFVSIFFVQITIDNLLLTIFSVFLTSLLFSVLGLINGIFAKNFDDISIVPTFILTPLIYLGGIFYSIEILTSEWQFISKLNPILYIVNFFRFAMLGSSEIDPMQGFVLILFFTFLFSVIAYTLLVRGVGTKE